MPEGSLQKTCSTNILHVPVVLSRIERRTGLHGPSEAIWMQTSLMEVGEGRSGKS